MTVLLIIALVIATILVSKWGLDWRRQAEGLEEGLKRRKDWVPLETLNRLRMELLKSSCEQVETLTAERFKSWRETEIAGIRTQERNVAYVAATNDFERWKVEREADIRADAINRSTAITKGKLTEHLVPFFPEFPYNARDARFLGSPVDLLIFNGMSEGELTEIVFLEIKTGNSQLTARERQIRDRIKEGAVKWEELRI